MTPVTSSAERCLPRRHSVCVSSTFHFYLVAARALWLAWCSPVYQQQWTVSDIEQLLYLIVLQLDRCRHRISGGIRQKVRSMRRLWMNGSPGWITCHRTTSSTVADISDMCRPNTPLAGSPSDLCSNFRAAISGGVFPTAFLTTSWSSNPMALLSPSSYRQHQRRKGEVCHHRTAELWYCS